MHNWKNCGWHSHPRHLWVSIQAGSQSPSEILLTWLSSHTFTQDWEHSEWLQLWFGSSLLTTAGPSWDWSEQWSKPLAGSSIQDTYHTPCLCGRPKWWSWSPATRCTNCLPCCHLADSISIWAQPCRLEDPQVESLHNMKTCTGSLIDHVTLSAFMLLLYFLYSNHLTFSKSTFLTY